MKRHRKLVVVVLLLFSVIGHAYKVTTHVRFSQQAAACSELKSTELMADLGLEGLNEENDIWSNPILLGEEKVNSWMSEWMEEYEPNVLIYRSTIKTLIGWGAKYEDEEIGARPLNHYE